jgi:hypothetical protein
MVVAVVGVAVAGVFMYGGLSRAAEQRRVRNQLRDQLSKYYSRQPFPSAENVEQEKANVETVRGWYERLLKELQQSNITVTERNPIAFNGERERITASLLAVAPKGESGDPVVMPDMMFGFERYKEGNLALPADVPRLMRQLRMIELLVRELYAARILNLTSVKREEFEVAAAAPVQSRFGSVAPERKTVERDSRIQGVVPLDRQKFSFEFEAKEATLVDILNRISAMNIFSVVTHLEVTKDGEQDYKLAPPANEGDAAARKAALATDDNPQPEIRVVKEPPLTRTARLVSGRDRESSARVKLDVEVYSFEEEA